MGHLDDHRPWRRRRAGTDPARRYPTIPSSMPGYPAVPIPPQALPSQTVAFAHQFGDHDRTVPVGEEQRIGAGGAHTIAPGGPALRRAWRSAWLVPGVPGSDPGHPDDQRP